MGWTVYYEGYSTTPIADQEKDRLFEHQKNWNSKLHEGCEEYYYEIKDGGKTVSGITKVEFSQQPNSDFVTILSAVEEAATILSDFDFKISDDFLFQKVSVSDIGKIENPNTFLNELNEVLFMTGGDVTEALRRIKN